jgi:hypothetical protein
MLSYAWPSLPLALNNLTMLPPRKSRNIREKRLSPRRAPKRSLLPLSRRQTQVPRTPVASVTIANNDFFNDGEGERRLVTTF